MIMEQIISYEFHPPTQRGNNLLFGRRGNIGRIIMGAPLLILLFFVMVSYVGAAAVISSVKGVQPLAVDYGSNLEDSAMFEFIEVDGKMYAFFEIMLKYGLMNGRLIEEENYDKYWKAVENYIKNDQQFYAESKVCLYGWIEVSDERRLLFSEMMLFEKDNQGKVSKKIPTEHGEKYGKKAKNIIIGVDGTDVKVYSYYGRCLWWSG